MLRRTPVLAGTFTLVFLAAHVLAAQVASRPRTGAVVAAPKAPPPHAVANRPRIAGIAPAPAVIPDQNGVPTAGFINDTPPQVAAFYFLPAIVLTDGRVFANFNGRYEQVLRRCPVTAGTLAPGFASAACWVVDANGRYQVIQQR